MAEAQITAVVVASVAFSTPLVLAALGALISDRAGVFAIGMEGYMLVGAFTAAVASHAAGEWVGLLAGAAGGVVTAAVYAVLAITLRADQVIAGLAIAIVAVGLTTYLNGLVVPEDASTFVLKVDGLPDLAIPLLSSIPVIGPGFFDQSILVYLAVVAVVLVVLFLGHTHAGLSLRATGERPIASEVRGISVARVRYAAVLTSGLLGGLGGTVLSLVVLDTFVDNMTAGRGFIALAAVFFAGWRPLVAFAACVLFGTADAAQVYVTTLGFDIPPQLVSMFPYLLTIAALAVFVKNRDHPAALGQPYLREAR